MWSDDYAAAVLAAGATAVFVRYNTGAAVADNGRELSELLDGLVRSWPQQPVSRLIIVGTPWAASSPAPPAPRPPMPP